MRSYSLCLALKIRVPATPLSRHGFSSLLQFQRKCGTSPLCQLLIPQGSDLRKKVVCLGFGLRGYDSLWKVRQLVHSQEAERDGYSGAQLAFFF